MQKFLSFSVCFENNVYKWFSWVQRFVACLIHILIIIKIGILFHNSIWECAVMIIKKYCSKIIDDNFSCHICSSRLFFQHEDIQVTFSITVLHSQTRMYHTNNYISSREKFDSFYKGEVKFFICNIMFNFHIQDT